ncbi:cytochrome P450 [Streptomyces yaizuensis]|uniref:Cytochrome P450 n=1 Tax=Streptomyces yaizuensis TaxID=2989713 RepID=A0ABQ5NT83_9ACTN|nr:cytochrome P450 [Streptomyces sp. YSPA8]GLF93584.1 cytochrome P450 [Streptomyces sp. YSPA8]
MPQTVPDHHPQAHHPQAVPDYPAHAFAGEPVPLPDTPVARVRLPSGIITWLVTGYDEVRTVLNHPLLSREVGRDGPRVGTTQGLNSAPTDGLRTLQADGAVHRQVRRLAARPFHARRIGGLRRRARELTDGYLDVMENAGPPADLVAALAHPLPMTLITELFAVPERDRADSAAWSDTLFTVLGISQEETDAARHALDSCFAALIEERRASPGDDLLSAWLTAQEGTDRLTDAEVNHLAVGLLIAGHETTVNAIGAGMWRLFHHPEQLAALRADPGLLPGAVEEILRHQSLGAFFLMLVARGDVEVGGVTIHAGEVVMPLPQAANRDPARFPDPDRFDIRRPGGGHLSFGHGPHACLGAALARVELEAAIGALNRRFPGLRPAGDDLAALAWRGDRLVAGLAELPVTW